MSKLQKAIKFYENALEKVKVFRGVDDSFIEVLTEVEVSLIACLKLMTCEQALVHYDGFIRFSQDLVVAVEKGVKIFNKQNQQNITALSSVPLSNVLTYGLAYNFLNIRFNVIKHLVVKFPDSQFNADFQALFVAVLHSVKMHIKKNNFYCQLTLIEDKHAQNKALLYTHNIKLALLIDEVLIGLLLNDHADLPLISEYALESCLSKLAIVLALKNYSSAKVTLSDYSYLLYAPTSVQFSVDFRKPLIAPTVATPLPVKVIEALITQPTDCLYIFEKEKHHMLNALDKNSDNIKVLDEFNVAINTLFATINSESRDILYAKFTDLMVVMLEGVPLVALGQTLTADCMRENMHPMVSFHSKVLDLHFDLGLKLLAFYWHEESHEKIKSLVTTLEAEILTWLVSHYLIVQSLPLEQYASEIVLLSEKNIQRVMQFSDFVKEINGTLKISVDLLVPLLADHCQKAATTLLYQKKYVLANEFLSTYERVLSLFSAIDINQQAYAAYSVFKKEIAQHKKSLKNAAQNNKKKQRKKAKAKEEHETLQRHQQINQWVTATIAQAVESVRPLLVMPLKAQAMRESQVQSIQALAMECSTQVQNIALSSLAYKKPDAIIPDKSVSLTINTIKQNNRTRRHKKVVHADVIETLEALTPPSLPIDVVIPTVTPLCTSVLQPLLKNHDPLHWHFLLRQDFPHLAHDFIDILMVIMQLFVAYYPAFKAYAYGSVHYKAEPNDIDILVNSVDDSTIKLLLIAIQQQGGVITADYLKNISFSCRVVKCQWQGIAIDFIFSDLTPDLHSWHLDYTIGAQYYDLPQQSMLYPQQYSQQDLANKCLRAIISPDALYQRDHSVILRTVRLVAGFGFHLAAETAAGFAKVCAEPTVFSSLKADKLYHELSLLLDSVHALVNFQHLRGLTLLEKLFIPISYLSDTLKDLTYYLIDQVAHYNAFRKTQGFSPIPSLLYYAAYWFVFFQATIKAALPSTTDDLVLPLTDESLPYLDACPAFYAAAQPAIHLQCGPTPKLNAQVKYENIYFLNNAVRNYLAPPCVFVSHSSLPNTLVDAFTLRPTCHSL